MSSGKIDQSNYQSFRLFAVAGKTDYQNESDAKIDKIIKENNILYERIDRGLRFGNLEAEMSKTLDTNIINDIEREYKRNSEKWSETFTYASIVAAMEKKQAKMENPLNIENEDIVVYGDLPINALAVNDQVIIRNEGSQTAKKRTKNILIFNSDQYASIHLKVSCNITVLNNAIVADDAEYTKKGKSIIFKFIREEISFHKIQIEDKSNNITYIFKIAIMDMPAQFILPTVKHSFSIVYKPKKSNCRIKLVGVGTDLVFNKGAEDIRKCKLGDNEIYSCKYEIELQKRKIDVLAETITNCYTKLANKKNLIKTIVMDPETLDLKYLSEEGIEIPKDSLSAGEQQLMVISILWALAICSKKKLPVIIDTPLSRLDSLHRTALITTYFPNAGEQTIILSTDSEIDENYYELMRENVGDEFTLKYDEDSKSTSIERGYLIGAKL